MSKCGPSFFKCTQRIGQWRNITTDYTLIISKFHFRQKNLQNDVGRGWHFALDKDVLNLTVEANPRMRIMEFVDKEFFVSMLIKLLSKTFKIQSRILPLHKLLYEHKFRNYYAQVVTYWFLYFCTGCFKTLSQKCQGR